MTVRLQTDFLYHTLLGGGYNLYQSYLTVLKTAPKQLYDSWEEKKQIGIWIKMANSVSDLYCDDWELLLLRHPSIATHTAEELSSSFISRGTR